MKLRMDHIGKGNRDADLGNGSLHLVGDRVYAINSLGVPSFLSRRTGEWISLPMPEDLLIGSDHAGDLVDDKIYVTGGEITDCVVEFDLALESIARVESFGDTMGPTERKSMTALYTAWRREIVFFGGHTAPEELDVEIEESLVLSNETYSFNVDSKSWQLLQLKGGPPLSRTGHAAVIKGFNMYVYGGYNHMERYLREVWIAHLNTRARPYWSMPRVEGRVPPGRVRATFNNLAGYLVLFGGYSRNEDIQTRVDLYCPSKSRWITGVSTEGWRRDSMSSVEVTDTCPRYTGFPLGIEVSEGVLIFTYNYIHGIKLDYE